MAKYNVIIDDEGIEERKFGLFGFEVKRELHGVLKDLPLPKPGYTLTIRGERWLTYMITREE